MQINLSSVKLQQVSFEYRVDSRVIAQHLGVDHKATIQLIDRYIEQLKRFGQLTFKMCVVNRPQGGGAKTRYMLLNRSQAELLLTLSRNTPQSLELKVQLILAFDQARSSLESSGNYIPYYHAAHESLQNVLGNSVSSAPPVVHHMNLEKLINKTFGLTAGTRNKQPPEIKLMVGSAMALATRVYAHAYRSGASHKEAYSSFKQQLETYISRLSNPTLLEGDDS